jgi:hypothetical protein
VSGLFDKENFKWPASREQISNGPDGPFAICSLPFAFAILFQQLLSAFRLDLSL